MVLPSHSEGLPNVVLEAFALGKPVIATAVAAFRDRGERRQRSLGAGAPARRSAEAMVACFREPSKMAAWGQAARQTVQTRFTFEEQNRRLESIYRRFSSRCIHADAIRMATDNAVRGSPDGARTLDRR